MSNNSNNSITGFRKKLCMEISEKLHLLHILSINDKLLPKYVMDEIYENDLDVIKCKEIKKEFHKMGFGIDCSIKTTTFRLEDGRAWNFKYESNIEGVTI